MKKVFIFFVTVFLLSFVEISQQQTFQQLYALTGGTWVMKTKKGFLCERWEKISGNLLRNQSYKVEGADTTLLEHVQLSQERNGINYTSTVANENGGNAVPFKLTESKDGLFIFSNPEHDYPQRIVYHLISKDSLHAWIDGKYNGKQAKQDFYYKRVN